jgi:hypothetical protein
MKDGSDGPEAHLQAGVFIRQMSEEQTNFKVTDRRLFNADGSPRELSPDEKAEPSHTASAVTLIGSDSAASVAAGPPTQASSASRAPAEIIAPAESSKAQEESTIPDVDDPASFIHFAMSIASNAASSLGMMEHPVNRKREVDLELAKHWIDVLGMLQHKTRGNLVLEEEQILEGWLADLRMQYVSLTSTTAASKAPRAYTGRDIIGGG